MTVGEFVRTVVERLSPLYPENEAKSMAFRLLDACYGIPSYKYVSESYTELDKVAGRRMQDAPDAFEALEKIAGGCPIQYVLGFAEFRSLRFKVGEGCLIPRPETEELVAQALEFCRDIPEDEPFNILDMGTGSGCIAFSMAAEVPGAMVYACDLSSKALDIACRQRIKLQGARPVFFLADMLQDPPAGLPHFDVIISNPPYVRESEKSAMRTNVLDWEPEEALFVPDDDPLKYYRAIASWADKLLKEDGHVCVEINEDLSRDTAALFPGSKVVRDIFGKPRFVIR